MGKRMIGLDIGSSTLKLVQCDSTGRVVAFGTEPIPDGLVRDGRILSMEAMSPVIRAALQKHRIRGSRCAVNLPANLAFTRRVTVPMMTPEQLRLNLPYDFRDYITDDKDKYFYDYSVLDMRETDEDGEELDLMAAATLKSTVEEYSDMLRRAGLRLNIAAPYLFSYANILRQYSRDHAVESEYVIVDLGHSSSRVHIFTGARFEVTRVIELGGAAIDVAIGEALNVDHHVAQSHKDTNYNQCQSLPACLAIYQSIGLDIMRVINFYGYNNSHSNIDKIYICGGGIRNNSLLNALRETTGSELCHIKDLLPSSLANRPDRAMLCAAYGITLQS